MHTLVDNGYDVFLGNSRGNKYSLGHTSLKTTDQKFWDYSFTEIGKYDVPANVKKILKITKKEKLNYVGMS